MVASLQVCIKENCLTLHFYSTISLLSSKQLGHILILLVWENVGTDSGSSPCIKWSLLLKSVLITSFSSNKKIIAQCIWVDNIVKHYQISRALLHNFLADLSSYTSLRAIQFLQPSFVTLVHFFMPGSKETKVSFTLKNRSPSVVVKVMLHKPSTSSWTWKSLWHK